MLARVKYLYIPFMMFSILLAENPTGGNKTLTVLEDGTHTFAASDFTFSDGDGHTFAGIIVVSVETAGDLEYNGSDVTAGQTITDVTLLTFAPASNSNGNNYASFTHRVTDSNGENSDAGSPYTTTFNVTAVNDAPTVSSAPTVTSNEDTEYAFSTSDFNYTDIESSSLDHIQITSLESAGTLYLDANDNDTNDSEDVTGDQDITAANISSGHLRFAPASNANGAAYATFAYKVNDGTAYASSASTMTIDITAVNDAPVLAAIGNLSTDEDTPKVITVSATDVENDNLSYSVSSSSANISASMIGTTLTMTPATNWSGSVNITVTVTDGSESDSQNITVTVNAVNDAPVLASIGDRVINEDGELNVLLSAFDVEGDQLSYSITDGVNITVSLSGNDLTLTPNQDFNGSETFTITVTDGYLEDSETFTLTIKPRAFKWGS